MNQTLDHVTVCICTYRRQQKLAALLSDLQDQETAALFTFSIVVVDNDHAQSAKSLVESVSGRSQSRIDYYCEPEQNIALARNMAVQNARGDFVAFIDDDEFPDRRWLLTMYRAIHEFGADGVLGPVAPRFEEPPPRWVVNGRFYDKPRYKAHKTGSVLKWQDTRTSNVLLRNDVFRKSGELFNPALGRGGEDKEFFSRAINRGYSFVWCDEALVFETISPGRCKRVFMLKRALLRGKVSLLYPSAGGRDVLRSILAISIYTPALPLLLFAGHHVFMTYLVAYCDHVGKVLALLKMDVIKEKYLLE